MTSQIAIMNYSGIAIASDTITSITSQSGTKTIGNTSKIWEIGPKHAVAVLHSGSTYINGVLHQMHFNEWAKTLDSPLPTLKQYVDSYLAFSSHSQSVIPKDSEREFAKLCISTMYSNICNHVDKELPDWNHETNKWTANGRDEIAITKERIQHFFGLYSNITEFKKMSDSQAKSLLNEYKFDLAEMINEIFSEHPINEELIEMLIENAFYGLSRTDSSVRSTSDLAFVGYGLSEPYGGSIKLECRGIYGGNMQCFENDYTPLSPNVSSRIATFGQSEAIWGFLRGYRWSTLDYIVNTTTNWILNSFELTEDDIVNVRSDIADEIYSKTRSWTQENFTDPMFSSVEGMSTYGLAELAESLVGIQSTSTYAEQGTATVGGLIEVATIDRIRGIVWTKKVS